jgi:hypothetical protein
LAVAIILTGHLGRSKKEKPWPERHPAQRDKRKYSLSAADGWNFRTLIHGSYGKNKEGMI